MHYLILDDDIHYAETLQRAMTRRQLNTQLCHSLIDLPQLLANELFGRAIVDLKLGADNGLQAVDLIRQSQPQCAILMLTGYASIATAVEAMKRGATHYLPKPADLREILAAFDDQVAVFEDIETPSVNRLEWEHIQRVLHENEGNISATARALKMHRRTLQRKLAKNPVAE
ncbi:response regulator transcription factor [Simiduia agarivorans]|uniref:Two component Fis family transcriptional regulator n=1 Tax=Simiduia agarivorans (strain DSM 21679 / JCM 13881 / BCRC 17597 / SA1) TaxID=1117647 RepID=K4KIC4_SIMAS|nr:response regulator [Simiduia agarivorans]AFU98904.1 two component Fis family transcriptional regulator [Simiduia agarivorans SA1 = DSM 21679]